MATTRRSSISWVWPATGAAFAALVGALAWGLFTYQGLQDRLEGLPRTTVPGEVTFEVSGPQGVTVFYEDPRALGSFVVWSDQHTTVGSSPVELAVTGPSGPHVLDRYERDLRFDVGGRVATALATFDAPEAGTYVLEVSGDVPAAARVSVGDVVDGALLLSFAGAVGLFVVALLGAAAIVVIVLVRGVGAPDRSHTPTTVGRQRPRR